MQRFTFPQQAQGLLEPFGLISNHFRPRRHLLTAQAYRAVLADRFRTWRVMTETAAAALA
jgi:putative transposase